MSVFTNPASGAPGQAEEYTRAILDLLGSRDPLDVLERTADALGEATADLTDAQLGRPEAPGKWSVRQVIRHLADSEIVWAYRLRMVLAQDRPTLTGYDQDAWAARLRYGESDVAESLSEFATLRRGNLRVLRSASTAELQRVGLHAERGEESLEHMLRLYAGHDLLHLRQVERIRGGGVGRGLTGV
ncbi:MAG TPA: DinB family protein [Longimicrobiaceae bacterium]|nr:DinB family protein [Longimicrobiaceae bacterium]